jgi:molybdate transport system substrate-binding protein
MTRMSSKKPLIEPLLIIRRIRRLLRQGILPLCVLLALWMPDASAEIFLQQDGLSYTDPKEALDAIQRDLDRQSALVAVSSSPLAGKLLVVLPDRDRISHMLPFRVSNLSEDARNFLIDSFQRRLHADAKAIVKAHPVGQIDIVERNDTVDPAFEDYNYIVWYQVNPAPTAPGGIARWQIGKRGSLARLAPKAGTVPAERAMAEFVAAIGSGLTELATQPASALPPPNEALPMVQIGASNVPVGSLGASLQNKARVTLSSLVSTNEELAAEIEKGGLPLDIFVASDEATMDRLERLHRIDPASRHDLVADRLVLVVPADSPRDVAITAGMSIDELIGDGKIVWADPGKSPSAAAAKAALQALGLWDAIQGRLLRVRATPETAAYGVDVAQFVGPHMAPAAIAYSSEAPPNMKAVRIAGVFPDSSYPPARYPIAIVAGHDRSAVRATMDFMLSDGRALLVQMFGYRAP